MLVATVGRRVMNEREVAAIGSRRWSEAARRVVCRGVELDGERVETRRCLMDGVLEKREVLEERTRQGGLLT